jgi:hypothetical protein
MFLATIYKSLCISLNLQLGLACSIGKCKFAIAKQGRYRIASDIYGFIVSPDYIEIIVVFVANI